MCTDLAIKLSSTWKWDQKYGAFHGLDAENLYAVLSLNMIKANLLQQTFFGNHYDLRYTYIKYRNLVNIYLYHVPKSGKSVRDPRT